MARADPFQDEVRLGCAQNEAHKQAQIERVVKKLSIAEHLPLLVERPLSQQLMTFAFHCILLFIFFRYFDAADVQRLLS